MMFQFDSLASLLWMQGHGPYVWAAYGMTVLGLMYLTVAPWVKHKHFEKVQRARHNVHL